MSREGAAKIVVVLLLAASEAERLRKQGLSLAGIDLERLQQAVARLQRKALARRSLGDLENISAVDEPVYQTHGRGIGQSDSWPSVEIDTVWLWMWDLMRYMTILQTGSSSKPTTTSWKGLRVLSRNSITRSISYSFTSALPPVAS